LRIWKYLRTSGFEGDEEHTGFEISGTLQFQDVKITEREIFQA
jgi:hypothetical protein